MSRSESTRHVLMVTSVCGATVLSSFQSGAMTVSLATIQKSLSIPDANLQWPISAYSLSYGCFLLLSGRLADIFGRKKLFLLGTIWFALLSICIAFAKNQVVFIVLMALLGLGPAANTPASVGIFGSTLRGTKKDFAFAFLGAGQPVGFIAGLCLGGVLCETYASWPAIFYIQGSLAVLFSVIGYFCVPEVQLADFDLSVLKRLGRIDWTGAALSSVGLCLLTFSLADAQSAPKAWRTPYIPVLLAISVILFSFFLQWERVRERRGKPTLVPLSLFRLPNFGVILAVGFTAWWSFNTLSYFATLYYQLVLELSPVETSLRFLPMCVAGVGLHMLAGYLVSRLRPAYLISLGLVGSLVATILFALVDVHASYWSMMFLIMVFVVGTDAAFIVSNIQLSASVDSQSQALAGGIFNVATRLGTALGLAVTSAVSTAVSTAYSQRQPLASPPSVLLPGYHAAGWVCFGMSVLSITIALVGLRRVPVAPVVPAGGGDAGVGSGIELQSITRVSSKVPADEETVREATGTFTPLPQPGCATFQRPSML